MKFHKGDRVRSISFRAATGRAAMGTVEYDNGRLIKVKWQTEAETFSAFCHPSDLTLVENPLSRNLAISDLRAVGL